MSTPTTLAPTTRRVLGLTRTNTTVLVRNRLNLFYAFVLPLLPLGLLFLSERGDVTAGIANVTLVLMMALVFPVYYNVLSMVVTRRDELVLKRLRTGEARDAEILLAIAAPGTAITLVVTMLTVPLGAAAGLPLPVNPVLVVVGVLLACAAFAALAVWTAAWTRSAEAAQMTSMPVIVLAMVGLLTPAFPESVHPWLALTPGGALDSLVRVAWFGRTTEANSADTIGFVAIWAEVAPALAVLAAWAVLSMALARRSMRWEPRT